MTRFYRGLKPLLRVLIANLCFTMTRFYRGLKLDDPYSVNDFSFTMTRFYRGLKPLPRPLRTLAKTILQFRRIHPRFCGIVESLVD